MEQIEDTAQEQVQYPRFKATTLLFAALRGAIIGLLAGAIWAYFVGAHMLSLEYASNGMTQTRYFQPSWVGADWDYIFRAWLTNSIYVISMYTPIHPLLPESKIAHILLGSAWHSSLMYWKWNLWILGTEHIALSIVKIWSIYGALIAASLSLIRWIPSFFGSDFLQRVGNSLQQSYKATSFSRRFLANLLVMGSIAILFFQLAHYDGFDAYGGLGVGLLSLYSAFCLALLMLYPIPASIISIAVSRIFGATIGLTMIWLRHHPFFNKNPDSKQFSDEVNAYLGIGGDDEASGPEHLRGAEVLSADELAKIIRKRSQ
ncbi:MAG: hypothetical protein M0Z99_34735 [Betaproteobacteria bacterium]|nr:hypothetical protein [Betaproteobacteria bacterium]